MKKMLILCLVTISLAACSSGKFSKGEDVLTYDISQESTAYCEGPVISDKKGVVIVNVKECHDGYASGDLSASGATQFKESNVHTPDEGLPLIKARNAFYSDPDMTSILNSSVEIVPAKSLTGLIKKAKAANLPFVVSFLKVEKTSLPLIVAIKSNQFLSDYPTQQAIAKVLHVNLGPIEASITAMTKQARSCSNRNYLVAPLLAILAKEMSYAGLDAYKMEFDPTHPNSWVKTQTQLLTDATNLLQFIISQAKSVNVDEPYLASLLAMHSGDPSTLAQSAYIASVQKAANQIYNKNVSSSMDNPALLDYVKKQLESKNFKYGIKQAIDSISQKIKGSRASNAEYKHVFSILARSKYWYLAASSSSFARTSFVLIKPRELVCRWAYYKDQLHSHGHGSWPVEVDPAGNIVIRASTSSDNDLDGWFHFTPQQYSQSAFYSEASNTGNSFVFRQKYRRPD